MANFREFHATSLIWCENLLMLEFFPGNSAVTFIIFTSNLFDSKTRFFTVCDNKCSGHGKCHSGSKQCECDIFWMENFFRVYLGDGTRNCGKFLGLPG